MGDQKAYAPGAETYVVTLSKTPNLPPKYVLYNTCSEAKGMIIKKGDIEFEVINARKENKCASDMGPSDRCLRQF